jgi:Putative membrane protein insertion efficiency factor
MLSACFILIWSVSLSGCSHTSGDQSRVSLYDNILGMYHEPLNHLSAVRRGVCPMHPSCSEYSRQAVEKHGFNLGWAMAMDRLLRCGRDELRRAPPILVNGQYKFYDPLSANDNWWYVAGESTQADLDKTETPVLGR